MGHRMEASYNSFIIPTVIYLISSSHLAPGECFVNPASAPSCSIVLGWIGSAGSTVVHSIAIIA